MSGPEFNIDHEVAYGEVDQVSPLVRRVTAENPGKFTFRGTGTYIVGRGQVAIIDPGPTNEAHIEAVLKAVEGETVTHLLITHTHSDHSPGAALIKDHLDVPTWGFGPHPSLPADWPDDELTDPSGPEPARATGSTGKTVLRANASEEPRDEEQSSREQSEREGDVDFLPDVVVKHGDVIAGGGWTVEALHTPGHISNHLCFGLAEENGLFTGDHVMGWSTTVIPAPDGNLGHYLESLELLLPRTDEVYWPTHGAPVRNPQRFVEALIAHRNSRTEQVLASLGDGLSAIPDMVAVMYADKPKELHKPAAKSVLAHLRHLVEGGRVGCSDPDPNAKSIFSLG